MSLLLGIDTGGTYTDAVLLDAETKTVRASAKSLTTHKRLELGVTSSIQQVLATGNYQANTVGLVSVSTTLATNALVEGNGQRVCVVLIGLERPGAIRPELQRAIKEDEVILLAGGHNSLGEQVETLDLAKLETFLKTGLTGIEGFAVTGYFSVRNPAHELAAKALIERYSNKPVSCSFELAHVLDAPRRSLSTVLNARLVGLIARFISAVEVSLRELGVTAPLMLVKGDGSLLSVESAKRYPLETVYSGPAASLVGACHLAGLKDAVIADIGGTTTDIAVLQHGQPRLNTKGVLINGQKTVIQAVDMVTHGLGGDSDVQLELTPDGSALYLCLGPQRVEPLSLVASQHPEILSALEHQLHGDISSEFNGRFVIARSVPSALLTADEQALLDWLGGGVKALATLAAPRRAKVTMRRLAARGLISLCGFTPSDAAHVLGHYDRWHTGAATAAATLLARRVNNRGVALKASVVKVHDATTLSQAVLNELTRRSAEVLLDSCLSADGLGVSSQNPVIQAALDNRFSLTQVNVGLGLPLVGLGASAASYYPAVGKRLKTSTYIPEHAEVANAVGAVVGLVRATISLTISKPSESVFRVHADKATDFSTLSAALSHAEQAVKSAAEAKAISAGAAVLETKLSQEVTAPFVDGVPFFIEAVVSATSYGRPSF